MGSQQKRLQVAQCHRCGGYSYPVESPGCRVCGAEAQALKPVDHPGPFKLRNFITIYAELVPGLKPPYVIGEVELCPGLREEVLLTVADESELELNMSLVPEWVETERGGVWQFRPAFASEV